MFTSALLAAPLSGCGISATGGRLLFASDREGYGDVFTVDRRGSLTNLTNDPAGDWDPTWSPDGTKIAFTGHRSGDAEIWLMEPDGSSPRNLTNHPAWDYSPAWSPDGTKIAFVSERDGDQEIFVQPADTADPSAAVQLTHNEEADHGPAWSPEGNRIAYSGVRQGVETIHVFDLSTGVERNVTPHLPYGASPAWSPDGNRVAFVGWKDGIFGLYILSLDICRLELLYKGHDWMGSLEWPGDGKWIFFAMQKEGSRELYAMSTEAPGVAQPCPEKNDAPFTPTPVPTDYVEKLRVPVRLTDGPAWDDFPSREPGKEFAPPDSPFEENVPPASPAAPPGEGFARGVNMADLGQTYLVRDMGFNWAKGYANWETIEPEPGEFRWIDPDNVVNTYGAHGLKILLRIHGTPHWARPPDTHLSHPPVDPADFGAFMTIIATRYRGKVAAYEIWNEPNLNYEWGYLDPDPAAYTELLKEAYGAIKAVDPDALVLAGALATTGGGSPNAMGDLDYLQGMYDAGAKGHFDAFSSHPYAYGSDPDYHDEWGLSLSRVVTQREVMVRNGDADTPVWITELGWIIDNSWATEDLHYMAVDEETQGRYLLRSYEKVQEEWPWIDGLFLFNLDFCVVHWYPASEPMRWYAILNPDLTPRPAYTMLGR